MTKARRAAIPAVVFAVVALIHFSGIITSFDSRWSIPVARSLPYEGDIDLDEHADLLSKERFHGIEVIDGHSHSISPIEPQAAHPARAR